MLDEELDQETLVYDLEQHRAHCLNPAAALVWRLADGERTVVEIAGALPRVGLPAEEALVWSALDELGRAELLETASGTPDPSVLSRRDALRAVGLAAGATLLFPAVSSISAPLAAAAASCLTAQQCRRQNPRNCTGLPICQNRRVCCQSVTRGRGRRRRRRCTPRPC